MPTRPLLLIKLRIKEMLPRKWKSLRDKLKLTKQLTKALSRKNRKLLKLPIREWLKFTLRKLLKPTKPQLPSMPLEKNPLLLKKLPRKLRKKPLRRPPNLLLPLLLHEQICHKMESENRPSVNEEIELTKSYLSL